MICNIMGYSVTMRWETADVKRKRCLTSHFSRFTFHFKFYLEFCKIGKNVISSEARNLVKKLILLDI